MDEPSRSIFLREIRTQSRHALFALGDLSRHLNDIITHGPQMNDDGEPPRFFLAQAKFWAAIHAFLVLQRQVVPA